MKNTVHHGDCLEVMKMIPDGSVDLCITSPPYDNLRTYNGSLIWNEDIWKRTIEELYRVLKNGGVLVWIVGDEKINGSETGTSFKQAIFAKEVGFNIHDTMIWNKGNFTSVGSLRKSYAPVFEYMFIFSKGNIKTFNPIKDRKNKSYGRKTSGTIRERSGKTKPINKIGVKVLEYGQRHNIWECSPEKRNSHRLHPAMFPEKLIQDHIISWSNEGDTVLDPFAGSGTTAIACINTNRNYILIEKEQEYIDIINKRIESHQSSLLFSKE